MPLGDVLVQDTRYAVRGLRRQPGFALAAVSILALAIGATTALASLVYGVLLRPRPFPDPDRLVRLWEEHPGGTTIAGNRWLSHRTFQQWRQDFRSVQAVGGYVTSSAIMRIGTAEESVSAASLTPSMTAVLGLTPAVGRWFTDADAVAGAPRVVVIAYGLWREKYGALGADRRRLLGMVLREGLAVTLVGLGVGLAGAAGLSRLLEGLLFQVTPIDTLSFVAAPLFLLPAAVVTSLAPAYRAASVHPAEVLRQDS